MSEQASPVKDLIDRGRAPITDDLARFSTALRTQDPQSQRAPAAALAALRAARDHARAAHQALLDFKGRIRLIQGGAQALRGFLYLGDGLDAMLKGLSGSSTAAADLARARDLMSRSDAEFRKADRALGCPYGCQPKPEGKTP